MAPRMAVYGLNLDDVGTWRHEVRFEGQPITHHFAVGDLLLYGGFGDPT